MASSYDFSLTANHSHRCDKCGHEWAHSASSLNDMEKHTCRCGAEQTIVQNFASPRAEIAFFQAKIESVLKEFPNPNKAPLDAVEAVLSWASHIGRIACKFDIKTEDIY